MPKSLISVSEFEPEFITGLKAIFEEKDRLQSGAGPEDHQPGALRW
jgi:hypothetical protein